MQGSNITDASKALEQLVNILPDHTLFNIIGFGSSYEALFTRSKENNKKTVDKALKHIRNLQADLGGTELLSPLQFIYK
jgi:Ca-activated chloride channel family protein